MAEDLGVITPDVEELRVSSAFRECGFSIWFQWQCEQY